MLAGDQNNAALRHLFVWLNALNRALAAAVAQRRRDNAALQRHAGNLAELNAEHAVLLLDGLRTLAADVSQPLARLALDTAETEMAAELVARHGTLLPLARLEEQGGLTQCELAVLVACAAPQVDPRYGRIYGFLMDDLAQRAASLALLGDLAGGEAAGMAARRRMLGPGGALRRLGLLRASDPLSDDPATRLVPVPGLADWLTGASAVPPVAIVDPQLPVPSAADASACVGELALAARAMRNAPAMLVALWGGDAALHEDYALAIAAGSGLPVYRAPPPLSEEHRLAALEQAQAVAATLGAICWIEYDALLAGPPERRDAAARQLAGRPQRLLLSGGRHWSPIELVASRSSLEIAAAQLPPRAAEWAHDLAEIAPGAAAALSEEFHLGRTRRRAAIMLATSALARPSGDDDAAFVDALRRACRTVSAPDGGGSAVAIEPRRGLEDLILPAPVHHQVAEIARLYRHSMQVDREWGFGRLAASKGAIKVLFTGDPGTGKTLAAEALAAETGIHLLKVDLSQVVSKWIGETEKNLEEVFRHAEQCHSLLFFDEADALFGKRGEIRHGTDRYANMEVSYLLQRLESFSGGIVVLSSNLRDELDTAFTRRFQIAVHFPRPTASERQAIWALAFAAAPLAPDVRLDALAALELAGGGIVTAARMAALLAAAEGAQAITAEHLELAIERQFNKEARLLKGIGRNDGLTVARALR